MTSVIIVETMTQTHLTRRCPSQVSDAIEPSPLPPRRRRYEGESLDPTLIKQYSVADVAAAAGLLIFLQPRQVEIMLPVSSQRITFGNHLQCVLVVEGYPRPGWLRQLGFGIYFDRAIERFA